MPKKTSDISTTSDTMRTTKSEREKGEIIKRCFINMLKCIRVCKKTRKDKNNQENGV